MNVLRPDTFSKLSAFVLIALMLFSLPVYGQSEDGGEAEEAPNAVAAPESVAVEGVTDDAKIEKRITDILNASNWFTDVKVTSDHGFVVLSGKSSTDEHATWAETIASRTEDVIGVENDLGIESLVSFSESMTVVGDSLSKLYQDFLLRLPFLIAGIGVLVATWFASIALKFLLARLLDSRKRIRTSLKDLFKQLIAISVWVTGFLLATVVIFPGMTPAKALTVLGLGSVAIGFAFKDIFENFFAGVLILWRYPIEKGDVIEHAGIVGKVEEITIRNTMIRKPDGELVVAPNASLFKSNVEVLTNRPKRRVRITCGVAYSEDIGEAREVIRSAVSQCESISGKKSVEIFANEFGDSSVNFEIAWWTGSAPVEIRQSRDEVIEAVKKGLDNAGIEIPFPYRTLTFNEPLSVKQKAALQPKADANTNSIPDEDPAETAGTQYGD